MVHFAEILLLKKYSKCYNLVVRKNQFFKVKISFPCNSKSSLKFLYNFFYLECSLYDCFIKHFFNLSGVKNMEYFIHTAKNHH